MIRAFSPPALPACSATAGGAGSTQQNTCEHRALAPFCKLSRTRYFLNPLASPRPESEPAVGGNRFLANEDRKGNENEDHETDFGGFLRSGLWRFFAAYVG